MQRGKTKRTCFLTTFLIVGVLLPGLSAQTQQQAVRESQRANVDPFVDQVILTVSDFLGGVERLKIECEITVEHILPSGQSIQLSRSFVVRLKRPNHLRVELQDDRGHRRFFFDGNKLSIHDLNQSVFGEIEVTGSIDEMISKIRKRTGIDFPFADLLSNDIYGNYTRAAVSGTYVGLHYYKGRRYHHVLLSNDEVDYQMWVADGAEPLPAKVVVTYKNRYGAPRFSAEFIKWDLDPYLPALMFEFAPPVDADQIEILTQTKPEAGQSKSGQQ